MATAVRISEKLVAEAKDSMKVIIEPNK